MRKQTLTVLELHGPQLSEAIDVTYLTRVVRSDSSRQVMAENLRSTRDRKQADSRECGLPRNWERLDGVCMDS